MTQSLFDQLTRLHLPAFRAALEAQWLSPQYAEMAFEDRLGLLIDCEGAHRDNQRLKWRLQAARLPVAATLEELDLSPARGLDRRQILQLAQGEWIAQHLNAIILGPTGAGKTFLSAVLAHAACQHDFTVRYQRTSRLLLQLPLAHADGSYPKLLAALARVQLLVLDDWLRDPLTRPQSRDLLEILDDRCGRSSTLIVTQVPVADWHARSPDPTLGDALMDRLVHNGYQLNLTRKLPPPLGQH